MTRFGWILDFDGSPETIPLLNREGKTTDEPEEAIQLTIEETWDSLKQLLEFNAICFATDRKIHAENAILKPIDTSPLSDQIASRFPGLVATYEAIIKCLRKAKEIKSPDSQRHNENSVTKMSDEKQKNDECQANDDVTNEVSSSAEGVQISKDDKKLPESVLFNSKEPDNATPITGQHTPDNSTNSRSKDEDKISNSNIVTKKPATKPRKVSTANPSPKSEDESLKPVNDLSTPDKVPKKPSASPPSLGSEATPTPPRKKNPAPKPPGPPPLSKSHSNDLPSKPIATARTPEYKAKVPPPRPKPPSFKKNQASVSIKTSCCYLFLLKI